jgi:hypothetical protein
MGKKSQYRKGSPLSVGELESMEDGALVWVRLKESGESSYKINGPLPIRRLASDEGWDLQDLEFFPTDGNRMLDRDEDCVDVGDGSCITKLYQAVPKNEKN